MLSSFIFSALNKKESDIVIDAMEVKEFSEG